MNWWDRLRAERERQGYDQNGFVALVTRRFPEFGLTQGTLSSLELGKRAGAKAETLLPIAECLGISLHWLMNGNGSKQLAVAPVALDPEADARRWFLHRVEHEGLGTEAEALSWLEQHREPFTRPVPWNNQAFLAYRRHVEGGAAPAKHPVFVRYQNLERAVSANKNRWPDELIYSIANKAKDDRNEDLSVTDWVKQLDAIAALGKPKKPKKP